MELKDTLTIIGLFLNAAGLFIVIWKSYNEQKKENLRKSKEDMREEYKLRIYEFLLSTDLTVPQIVNKFNSLNPNTTVDTFELRKCIYEMIKDDCLLSYQNGKYTANTSD